MAPDLTDFIADLPKVELHVHHVGSAINSDDPPMFSTTLNHEYQVAADLLGLDEHGVAELAREAVRHSFLDDLGQATVLAEIDAHVVGR
jgi:adenosine deaminase